jgi:uncharacterized NAD(P)/FAD-binding protein YdhS
MTAPRVAIVGGGASGTLLALQLLRQARHPLEVLLVEPRRHLGRGLAYDAPHVEHLLNVPAERMSALPDEPDHFARWLERSVGHSVSARFVPRQVYGLYLEETLDAARASASAGVRLKHVEGCVESIDAEPAAVSLRISGVSQAICAQRVALALGNLPGPGPLPELVGNPLYVDSPWAPRALEGVGRGEFVLLVGSGLTMVDVALTLTMSERRTPLLAVSRHGLVPQSHASQAAPPEEAVPLMTLPPHLRSWLRALRQGSVAGADWRPRIDALRPLVPRLWARLGPDEQRRFLRHVRPYWETRRHRMAPEVAQAINGLVRGGGLRVQAGRVVGAKPAGEQLEVTLLPRGSAEPQTLRVGRLINATGPETDVTRVRSPLVKQLLRDGVARPDALRLGLDATPAGQLLDLHGRPSRGLYALGPLLRGALWETTAVPEIRLQAADLARVWLATLADAHPAAAVPVGATAPDRRHGVRPESLEGCGISTDEGKLNTSRAVHRPTT